MVPAFRGSDDVKQVRRNLESLDIGAKVLVDGHAMGIFPEGKSTDQAHLEMIRSGAARMAVQAVEEGAKELQVVPIGITYERKDRFRTGVLVHVGEPIEVAELLRSHDGEQRKARRALTAELESRLKEIVVHLDDPEWEPWLDDLEVLVPPVADVKATPQRRIRQRKLIADAMNYFLERDRPRAESVAAQIEAYRDGVRSAGLRVDSPVLLMGAWKVVSKLIGSLCLLLALLIPALLGTLHHLLPFVLVRKIASRMDHPGRLTIATHRLLVGVPFYLLWYAAVTVGVALFSLKIALIWLAAAPLAGVIAWHYWRRAGRTLSLIYHQLRLIFARVQLQQLRRQLGDLRRRLGELADEFTNLANAPPDSC